MGVMQPFGRFTPFASAGYRFVGESSQFDLRDVWLASAGATYRILESVDAGLFLFYQESASSAADDQLDLMPYATWRITDSWSTNAYVTAGLQDGSPDVGVGIGLTYGFAYSPG
jgi:hypothetical protein